MLFYLLGGFCIYCPKLTPSYRIIHHQFAILQLFRCVPKRPSCVFRFRRKISVLSLRMKLTHWWVINFRPWLAGDANYSPRCHGQVRAKSSIIAGDLRHHFCVEVGHRDLFSQLRMPVWSWRREASRLFFWSAAVWRCAQVIAMPSRPFEGPALDVFFWQVAWQTPFLSWFEGIARGYTALLRLGTLSIGCCGRVSSMHFTRLCIAACKCWVT